ncbi:MAG: glycosyltransferase family 4 protein [Deltaproteobacteria bacterium]|nr:glycosyltransferase family 4 protein [Deltaproteobacteria bacterium]
MSILEAIAHGIPVVAPDVGGISEIINNGEDGYLIETRDSKAFAEKCFFVV